MSGLLARIDQQLAACQDVRVWAELHAERAGYCARVGRMGEAAGIVSELRCHHGDPLLGRGLVRVMLAEGLIHYFSNLSSKARDRMFRAYLASTLTAGADDLGRLAAAWVAHVDFERGDYLGMKEYLGKAAEGLNPHEHSTMARLGLVAGDGFMYIGNRTLAQRWYEKSRHAAVDAGDQASIGALMYNRAAFGAARLRVERFALDLPVDEAALHLCAMELDSALEFQRGTNVSSLNYLVDLWKAKVMVLQRRFAEAIDIFEGQLANEVRQEDRPNQSSFAIDLAYCHFMRGDAQKATELLTAAHASALSCLDSDDRLIALGMLCKHLPTLQSEEVVAEAARQLAREKLAYVAECAELAGVLLAFDEKCQPPAH